MLNGVMRDEFIEILLYGHGSEAALINTNLSSEIVQWLAENEKRQVVNPDYLPYDPREGF